MASTRATIRFECNDGKVIYAERQFLEASGEPSWAITVPGGAPLIESGPEISELFKVVDEHARKHGGVLIVTRWNNSKEEWEPFKPSMRFGCKRKPA